MGNFDPLIAEIRRRRRNRMLFSALVLNWTFYCCLLLSPIVVRA